MAKRGKRRRKPKKAENLEQFPLPPEEHTYELKMEKRVKRMLEKKEKATKVLS